jgi:hypothetical protein
MPDVNLILHGVEIVLLLVLGGIVLLRGRLNLSRKAGVKVKPFPHGVTRMAEERTNKQIIGIYRCLEPGCNHYERRVEGPDGTTP